MRGKIKEIIVEYLEKEWFDKTEGGCYKYELYADYRDELDYKTAIEILKADDPMQKFYELIDECWFDYTLQVEDEHFKKIKELIEEKCLFQDDIDADIKEIIREEFQEIAYLELPYDHYLKQEYYANIMVDTGDGNYDYTLNSVYPAYCGTYGDTIDDKASIVWLAKQQGYTKTELKKALNEGDMKDPHGFLQTLRVELANAASHMNTLTFLAKMTLRELIELNELVKLQDRNGVKYDARKRPYCGYIIIDKKAETGLYDPWNGGGSVFEIELEKDIRLPIRFIRSALPDGGDGHSLDSVYGMWGGCWKDDVVKKIHAPVWHNKEED